MATPPTRAAGVTPAAGWVSNASPKISPAFDVVAGDLIVICGFTEDAFYTMGLPTWTGTGTVTNRQSVVFSGYCTAYLWTIAVTATATARTISGTATNGGTWNFFASVWRNHGGLGVTGQAHTSGAPSLALTTAANSAVVCGNSDWNASSPTGRTWRTVNGSAMTESSQGGNAGVSYEAYTGYSLDTGAAGTTTAGMLTPSAQKYSIIGAEILGTSSGTPANVAAVAWTASAVVLAPTVAGGTLPVPATVNTPAAAASAAFRAPAVSGLRVGGVTAPSMNASAAALPPTVTGLRAATVVASIATAAAAALAPLVSAGRTATVQVPPAGATASAPPPVVTGLKAAVVNAALALATAIMPAPTIITGGMAMVQAPPMGATALIRSPAVTAGRTATVIAPIATATALAKAPSVVGFRAATVMAAVAVASGILAPPTVSAGVRALAPAFAALGSMLAPTVTGETYTPPAGNPDGVVEAHLIPRSRVAGELGRSTSAGLYAYLIPRKWTGKL